MWHTTYVGSDTHHGEEIRQSETEGEVGQGPLSLDSLDARVSWLEVTVSAKPWWKGGLWC